ncbi:hypothetical protein LJY25_17110 [Hymenobacter sp. BT175]|uniref:hypothetical protein n=1 Tax=Hymenobacter translucens TaxID=2886507 RepID=UPI001D0ECF17|nr:hypothetical protein [Hymenobacter translucens]MCC2548172.1 hypothetical protein [Hymenobacter translucens]
MTFSASSSRFALAAALLSAAATLLSSCSQQSDNTQSYLTEPKAGDVYVMRFRPNAPADTSSRYWSYRMTRVTPDSAYLQPAQSQVGTLSEATSDSMQYSATRALGYGRPELGKLTEVQPGDVTGGKLVRVVRPD